MQRTQRQVMRRDIAKPSRDLRCQWLQRNDAVQCQRHRSAYSCTNSILLCHAHRQRKHLQYVTAHRIFGERDD